MKQLLTHLIRSKGWASLVRRAWAIVRRTGFTVRQMRRALVSFADLLARYDARATFPVTAVVLHRHPTVFRQLLARAPTVELAIHGHRHTDLSLLSEAEQAAEIEAAAALLRANGIPFAGFRAPYLRWNDSLIATLEAAGLWYDSSQCILWPVLDEATLDSTQRESVQLLCDFCQPLPAETTPALPYWLNDMLEIPVSLPDDEMLVERLRLRDQGQMATIWSAALEQCHARGELFVLQLHPERFPLCAEAVESLLSRAQRLRPAVWLTSLGGVTAWWREKRALHLDLAPLGEGLWEVIAEGPERGALMVRGTEVESENVPRYGQMASRGCGQPAGRPYALVSQRRFKLRADVCPCVGVSPAASLELVQFLTDQGYLLEVSDRTDGYTVYIDRGGDRGGSLARSEKLPLLAEIEAAPGPLVRWARWPEGAGSALAVTGDVDALTVWDYLSRPFEG